MIASSHLSRDQLLDLVVGDPAQETAAAHRHLADCGVCRAQLSDIKRMGDTLTRLGADALSEVTDGHLTDAQVSAYVYAELSTGDRGTVAKHLESCGRCMKHVMRVRAHRAALRGAGRESAATDTTVTRLDVRAKPRKWRSVMIGWSGLVAAGVAALAVYLGGDLAGTPLPQNDRVAMSEHKPDTAPPRFDYAMMKAQWLTLPVSKDGVDWYGGFIEATATGTVDMSKMINRVQAEMVAETTARHLAYAELAEIIGGVRVSGDTSYGELLLKASNLKVETDGFVRDARVIAKKIEWVGDAPKATVTLRVPLAGKEGLSALADKHLRPAAGQRPDLRVAASGEATRVVIDARGTGYHPTLRLALSPAVEDGGRSPERVSMSDVLYVPASEYGGVVQGAAVIRARGAEEAGTLLVQERDLESVKRISDATVSVVF